MVNGGEKRRKRRKGWERIFISVVGFFPRTDFQTQLKDGVKTEIHRVFEVHLEGERHFDGQRPPCDKVTFTESCKLQRQLVWLL